MSNDIDVKVTKELATYLYVIKDGKTIDDKLTLLLVIGLFASKTITLEKAAELSGKNIWDFISILQEYGIPWGDYTGDELQMDEEVLSKLTGGFYE